MNTEFIPMPDQATILDTYRGGKYAVLATPGSGKTTLISRLIARWVQEGVRPGHILVLTFTESAAQEFEKRTMPLLPGIYRPPEFSTIHAFCYGILRQFDHEYSDREIISTDRKFSLLEKILTAYPIPDLTTESVQLLANTILPAFRNHLGDVPSLSPRELEERIGITPPHAILFQHLEQILDDYETVLAQENFLDFDMMIQKALELLQNRPFILQLLRDKYRFLIEDEAQDSTPLQSQILEILAGENGNLLRVGDPNQSVYSFTGTDYRCLKQFADTYSFHPMRESQRSSPEIIDLANHLHQQYAPDFPAAVPICVGDNNPQNGWLWIKDYPTLATEMAYLRKALQHILNPKRSLAILCRTNILCGFVAEHLSAHDIPHVLHQEWENDFFHSDRLALLINILDYLVQPGHYQNLRQLLMRLRFSPTTLQFFFDVDIPVSDTLRKLADQTLYHVGVPLDEYQRLCEVSQALLFLIERIYYPVSHVLEWIATYLLTHAEDRVQARLLHQFWLKTDPGRRAGSLETFRQWLAQAGRWKIRQALVTAPAEQFTSPGTVHILTIHKAKGLEWDGVILPFFSCGGKPYFATLEKIRTVLRALQENQSYQDTQANLIKENDSESIRLAYVGITRARQFLSITCSHEKDKTIGLRDELPTDLFQDLRRYFKDAQA